MSNEERYQEWRLTQPWLMTVQERERQRKQWIANAIWQRMRDRSEEK